MIAGSNTGNPWTLTFTLRQPTTAIGFDLTDSAETGDVHFITDAGDNVTVVSCCRPTGNVVFFGFISDHPFTIFQVVSTGFGDGAAIDQVTVGLQLGSLVGPAGPQGPVGPLGPLARKGQPVLHCRVAP